MIFLLVSSAAVSQTIRRVNNNDGATGTNVYATIQEAHDAAANGDIILVEPSNESYGDLKCSKGVKIYGNGYFLNDNGLSVAANKNPSLLGSVAFVPGSNGAEIFGCYVVNISVNAVSDIVIRRNYFMGLGVYTGYMPSIGSAHYSSVNNILFAQNMQYNPNNGASVSIYGTDTYTISGLTITNNFLCAVSVFGNIEGGVIKYNTIRPGSSFGIRLENCVFENNIIIPGTYGEFDVVDPLEGSHIAADCSLNYNVTSGNLFPASVGTGNQNNVDLSLHFVPPSADAAEDAALKLKDDSPLKTAGFEGTEVGMFGGPSPYVLSGIPPIPSITNLKTTGTGTNTVPITVTFSAKSNN